MSPLAAQDHPEPEAPPRTPSPPPRSKPFQTLAPPRFPDDAPDYSDAFGNVARRNVPSGQQQPSSGSRQYGGYGTQYGGYGGGGGRGPSANGGASYMPRCDCIVKESMCSRPPKRASDTQTDLTFASNFGKNNFLAPDRVILGYHHASLQTRA